ncbi:penicillin-binding protein 1B [Solemya velum gill symbiont]|uniref:Penicillin-binding protein 1B n=5 Tax=Solemya velum gill symbiont TaxID=2340 RepID=A0A1T2GAZ6_SOVGS|nr:penicillin-binding protein 1B [Solemya velum gill symbiont]OOY35271.1 penicillin-binding protein 1B [Solemya velum gill symbiont]OOY37972.1 penicillin-binding protein 1B [Solemya velum gill symbiont]OOY48224.1 penicillin-binding protein 1B [Solemya velum gill symbiont]OOY51794.1 penicillin-binding protein 1B [Solemya velum gill symbiont]OOY53723.1 penicillin-binding protein 1B [Solemya velum gill symbiont]
MAKKVRKRTVTKRKKRRSKKKRGSFFGALFKLAFSLGLVGVLLLAGYMAYLYPTVTDQFEGQRWRVPARVYSRSLELYVGAPVTRQQLTAELTRLGYRKVDNPRRTGEWAINGGRLLVRSRGFHFWDGDEPEQYLDVHFGSSGISRLKEKTSGKDLAIVRLEPMEIGSIYPSHSEDRVILSSGEIPKLLSGTLLAVEDKRFYQHHGVDPIGLTRAVVQTLMGNRQGGSTITQQLIKNMYLTPRRDMKRKLKEAVMALILDAKFEKEDILTAYVNEIYLGQDGNRGIHGFGLASYFYFGAPVSELDLPRTALLVGMLKGPSQYNPRRNPKAATKRRNVVLSVLLDAGLISESQYRSAAAAPLGVTAAKGGGDSGRYPAFMDLVRRQLRRDYQPEDLNSDGLRIFTTFDPWVQQQVESATDKRLQGLEKQKKLPKGKLQSAAVVVTPQDGEVLALSGDRQPAYAGFNRALDATRPIGSLVKPAVYLTALEKPQLFSLVTRLSDTRLTLEQNGKIWEPDNYDKEEHGAVALETALAKSYNLATVHLGLELGLNRVIDKLHALGVSQKLNAFPSLLLGAVELTPLEVAQMYQSIASGGFRSPLRAIRDVLDQHGNPVQRYPLTVNRASQPGPVYLLTTAMQKVVSEGTSRYLNTIMPAHLNLAGKTGTTDNLRDSWFAGFSSDYVTVVWVGRDDNTPAGLTGASGALRVWGDIMKPLNPRPLELHPPETIEMVTVDKETGLLANHDCYEVETRPFLRGYAPMGLAPCAGGSIDGLFDFLNGGNGGVLDKDGHPDFESWDNTGSERQPRKSGDGLGDFLRSIFD